MKQNKTQRKSSAGTVSSSLAVEATPDNASNISFLESMLDIGFKRIGVWTLIGGSLQLNLSEMQKSSPALYAFVSAREILYVGKTSQSLAKRLYFYAKPGFSQRTNIRVNATLSKMLSSGTKVDIYGYSPESTKKVGEFSLSLPAGLEDDIIRKTKPIWNSRH